RQGIAGYLDAHRHGNTETTDLWDAIEAASGEPARSTMDSWIFQGGHPMVSVEASADGTSLTLSQERFIYHGEDDGTRWKVPLMLRVALAEDGEPQHLKLLMKESDRTLELPGKAEWVLVNDGAWG